MAKPDSQGVSKDYYAGIAEGRKREREEIIKAFEDSDSACAYWAIAVVEGDHEIYTEETVTVTISKRFINGKPSHWSAEVTGVDGEYIGSSMGPDFYSTFDSVSELITGDTGEFDDVHNEWVDFDANEDRRSDESV